MTRQILVVLFAIVLSGCTTALSGVGGTLLGLAGPAGVSAAERKIADRREWTSKRADLVAVIRTGMTTQAQLKMRSGDYACWRQIMDDALALHDREKPLFIVEKVIAKRANPPEVSAPPKPRKDCGDPPKTSP